jgi:DNA-binding NtrC family response regulator
MPIVGADGKKRDIPALCGHLLKEIDGGTDVILPDSELQKLVEYDWPGNVRELKNVLERAVILQKGPELRPSEFLTKTGEREAVPQNTVTAEALGEDRIMTVNEIEKNQIELALQRFSGNRTKAAEALGISLSTIKRRIRDMAKQV